MKPSNSCIRMNFKSVSMLALAMLLGSAVFSQGVHAGLKAGANLYKIDGKAFKDEFNYGYTAGAFAEINFSKEVGIQPEVLFNQQQTRTSEEFDDIYDDGIGELKDVKLNYLSIPILFNYSPTKIFTFQLGPQVGILLNKDQNLVNNGKNAFKTGDFAMLGGFQLNLGSAKIGARYALGLNSINDIDTEDWKNQGFQLWAGFRLF